MNFQELLSESHRIKQEINELRQSVFTEVTMKFDGNTYAFYASFSFERGCLEYNVVCNGIDIKLLSDVPITVLIAYSNFIAKHEDWADGKTDCLPYHRAIEIPKDCTTDDTGGLR